MSKDQTIGALITILCILVAVRLRHRLIPVPHLNPTMAKPRHQRKRTILANRHPSTHRLHSNSSHRRMDRLHHGNHTTTKTHRRNQHQRRHRNNPATVTKQPIAPHFYSSFAFFSVPPAILLQIKQQTGEHPNLTLNLYQPFQKTPQTTPHSISKAIKNVGGRVTENRGKPKEPKHGYIDLRDYPCEGV